MQLLDARPASIDLLWARPADDLWIASADREFAGMVEFVDGHFVATNRTGALLDVFHAVEHAMHAIAGQR